MLARVYSSYRYTLDITYKYLGNLGNLYDASTGIYHFANLRSMKSLDIILSSEINLSRLRQIYNFKEMAIGCSTCMDSFTARCDVSMTPCGHSFHTRCITNWLERGQSNCPQCRTSCQVHQIKKIYFSQTENEVEVNLKSFRLKNFMV